MICESSLLGWLDHAPSEHEPPKQRYEYEPDCYGKEDVIGHMTDALPPAAIAL